MSASESKPPCFGVLDEVFPLGQGDLRSIRPNCYDCPSLKVCLKAAVGSPEGVEMRADRMEAMGGLAGGGIRGFISRWSELKLMRQAAAEKIRKNRKT